MILDTTFLLNNIIIFVSLFTFNFIGATTGGSALLTLPMCIFLGFTPAQAIATTRFGVLGSTIAGWYGFKKENKVNYQIGLLGALFACAGAVGGAYYLISLPTHLIQQGLGVIMLLAVGLMLFPKKYITQAMPSMARKYKHAVGYFLLAGAGFLSGMFGGQGILLNFILISAFNQTFLEAAGTRTIINLFIALVSIIVYSDEHIIHWDYAAVILVAMAAGSYFGALYGLKKGDKWVEKIFLTIAVLMALYLILF
jgi:uncharacterized membrane protein YfcA